MAAFPSSVPRVAGPATARRFRATTLVAAAAMLVCYLPFSGTTGLLGQIGAQTGASTSALQWVSDAFTLALAGSVLGGGALAERFGRRRLVVVGLVLTALGSLIGLGAGSLRGADAAEALTAALAVAGVGGGVVMSSTLGLLSTTAPSPHDRARAISTWAAANVVGLAAGPFLAAAATALAPTGGPAWRWFYLPVAALAVAAARSVHGHAADAATRSDRASRADTAGLALGAGSGVALVYGVIAAGDGGWTSAPALIGLTAGVLLLTAFIWHERGAETPVVSPALFSRPHFTAAGLAAGTALFSVVGIVFVLSIALTAAGSGNLAVASTVGVLFLGNAVASLATGPLQTRWGPPPVLLAGLVLSALALLALTAGPSDLRWTALALPLAALGGGLGAVIATSTALAVASVPGHQAGMAGTANNAMRQLAAALGPAVLGGVLARQLAGGAAAADAVRACTLVLLILLALATVAVAGLLRRATAAR